MSTSAAIASGTADESTLSSTAERFCRRFSLYEIQLATEDFSDSHLIGNGGFGKVYKGLIDDGRETVAIKRLAPNSNQGAHEFLTEIETLSKLRHVNLVSLIGYCNENGEMILVYEYVAHGALAHHIYELSGYTDGENCSSSTWKQRLNICIGAGRGLDYLHTGTSIIHRDVKSTNILLDENFIAKVSDFGLAKHLTTGNSKSHVSTIVKGSFGYLDPSYFATGRLTKKSDTYAFGVVLLEVLSGRAAVDPTLGEDDLGLVMWAQEKISKGKVNQIVATNLREEISAECLKTFVGVAKRCLLHEPKERPTMAQVVVQLEFALEQHERKSATHNASRLLPLNAFWNRVRPSGYHATGSSKKDEKRVDVNSTSTTVSTTQEEALIVVKEDKQSASVEPIDALANPLSELIDITQNVSSKYLIGKRFQKGVFCGILKSGHAAAVKNVDYWNLPDHEFLSQVSLISSLKHENVAQLLGFCVDGGHQLLAYEFAQNGSLYDILHGKQGVEGSEKGPVLSWAQRVKIAFDTAKGLQYIHEKAQIHRNIKSCNVLLFDDLKVAKLADFGLSSELSDMIDLGYHDECHPSVFMQIHCYNPPEYHLYGKMSRKADVYRFGIILLELLTGCKVVDSTRPRHHHLVAWTSPYLREDKVNRIVDGRLNGDYPQKGAAKMAAIAALCVGYEAESRPDMSVVVKALRPLLNASPAL